LKGERTDVVALRNAAGFPNDYGDARDAFYPFLQDYGEVFDAHCMATFNITLTCPNGHQKINPPPLSGVQYKCALDVNKLPNGCTSGTIEELFKKNVMNDETCPQCQQNITNADYTVNLNGSHLIVEINRSVHMNGIRQPDQVLTINGCNAKRMNVFGIPMKMVGCMQHLANNRGDSGHYVVWKRNDSGRWCVINDNHPLRM
ncbi:hypothetical protein PFISCL1PPCAC_29215, partial [Pristionchus fissidentatus]